MEERELNQEKKIEATPEQKPRASKVSKKKEEEVKKPHPLTAGAKRMLVILFDLLGTFLGVYVGGVLMFIRPLMHIVQAYQTNTLLLSDLLVAMISIVLAASVGGGIWCVCDVVAGFFREKED